MSIEKTPLARVELVASSQDSKNDEQVLQASVWFPPQEHAFAIDSWTVVMRYGFVKADLVITDTRNSRYQNVRKIPFAETVVKRTSETKAENSHELSAEGELKSSWLRFGAKGGMKGAKAKTESRESSQAHQLSIAEEVDKGRFRLSGYADEDGILHGSVLHMDNGPLCTLKWDENTDAATRPLMIKAEVLTESRYLRAVVVQEGSERTLANQFERGAVLQAVIARSLNRKQATKNSDDATAVLHLASGQCTAGSLVADDDE